MAHPRSPKIRELAPMRESGFDDGDGRAAARYRGDAWEERGRISTLYDDVAWNFSPDYAQTQNTIAMPQFSSFLPDQEAIYSLPVQNPAYYYFAPSTLSQPPVPWAGYPYHVQPESSTSTGGQYPATDSYSLSYSTSLDPAQFSGVSPSNQDTSSTHQSQPFVTAGAYPPDPGLPPLGRASTQPSIPAPRESIARAIGSNGDDVYAPPDIHLRPFAQNSDEPNQPSSRNPLLTGPGYYLDPGSTPTSVDNLPTPLGSQEMVFPGTRVSRSSSLAFDDAGLLSFYNFKPPGEPESPSRVWSAQEKPNEEWQTLYPQDYEALATPLFDNAVASINQVPRSEAWPDSSIHLSIPPPIPPYYQPNTIPGNGPEHLPWDSGPPLIRDTTSVHPTQSLLSEFHIFGHPSQLSEENTISRQLSPLRGSSTSSCTPESPYSNDPDPFLSSERALHSVRKRRKGCYPKLLSKEEVPQLARWWYDNSTPGNRMPREVINLFFKIDAKGKSCIFCDDFTNRQEHSCEEHVSTHINHRPYRCIKCGESFSRKSNHSPTKHKPKWQETFSSTPTINTPYPNYADTDPTTHLYHDSIP